MSLHRVRIALKAPLGTPLSSGTLFGHLCWAKREAEGEPALEAWLATLPHQPWALSDGFPAGRLPRPLLPNRPSPPKLPLTRDKLKALEQAKTRAKLAWIGADTWRTLRDQVTPSSISAAADAVKDNTPSLKAHRLAHNSIDRRTGSTPDEGGLFFVDEHWPADAAGEHDIYVRTPDDVTAATLRLLFTAVGEAGYGRDATWGRGHFKVVEVKDAAWLDDRTGNRMLSLSHGVLTANMGGARYKLFPHFGKVGAGLLAQGVSAWKYPILLTRPGCTFVPADAGPFGRWLTGIHPERPKIGHNGFHLAIPYTEATDAEAQAA